MTVTRAEALKAVRTLIEWIGDDPNREGLRETPERVIAAWQETWGNGYYETPTTKLFNHEEHNYDTMVLVKGIVVHSHCEHHIAPFFGTADVAYLPDPEKGIVGLSKLARIVDHFARRLSVQERLTAQIADFLMEHVTGLGAGVIIRATHMCMCSRGVQQPHSETLTSALRGAFFENETTRSEFLKLAG